MQNYRESSHPHTDASRGQARPLEGSGISPRQILGVVLAAVLVAVLLSLFSLLAGRLYPGAGDCVLTDNAGCIHTGWVGSSEVAVAGVDVRRGV